MYILMPSGAMLYRSKCDPFFNLVLFVLCFSCSYLSTLQKTIIFAFRVKKRYMGIGDKYTTELFVTSELSAEKMGSGDMPVLATPAMVAMMENAAMKCVADDLEDGQTTVGIMMNTTHVKASAIGAKVYATAEIVAIDGRKISFKISAFEGQELIGEATHDRFIVTRDRFLSKLNNNGN